MATIIQVAQGRTDVTSPTTLDKQDRNRIFRAYVEQSEDGIFIASPEGVYLHVNHAGHRLLGYADGELHGKSIVDILPADSLPRFHEQLHRSGPGEVELRDWTLLRKDGSEVSAEILTQRLQSGFLLATVRDRSQHLREKEQQREAMERLYKLASQLPGMVYQVRMHLDGSDSMPCASTQIEQQFGAKPQDVRDDAAQGENAPRQRREGRETILVVEDEQSILALAREALHELGYSVLTETNGLRALELAEQYPDHIHLLFTDVVMPKMGGKELASRLSLRRRGMKVLYTSGYTGDTIVNRGVLQQGIQFIQKPYTLQALGDKVREILDS